MMRIIVILIVLFVASFGCSSSPRTGDSRLVETSGTLQYIEVEGGFFGIVADDGRKYDPQNLEDSFKEDGLRVHFRARLLEDVASIRMWGTVVEILSIERI